MLHQGAEIQQKITTMETDIIMDTKEFITWTIVLFLELKERMIKLVTIKI